MLLLLLLLHLKLLLLLLLLLHVKLLLLMWIPHLLMLRSELRRRDVAHRVRSRRKDRNGTERKWRLLLLLLLLLLTKSRSRQLLASKSIASGGFLIRFLLRTLKCEHLICKSLHFGSIRHLTDSCRRFRGVLRVL